MRSLQLALAIAAGISTVSAPINVGATDQTKNANLVVNGLAVWGNAIFAGTGGSYLNFGATSGPTGYGIRDNGGTLEFKSTGGSWNNLTNTVTNVLGIGAVSQIKFSDGTTQTTAAGTGGISERAFTETAAYQVISGSDIPLDDTIPQSNEGTQLLSATITQHSASSRLRFGVNIQYTTSGPNCITAAVFRDSDVNATYATIACPYSTDWDDHLTFQYEVECEHHECDNV